VKLVTFSTLYPSSARPAHGVFVETRLRYLLSSGMVQSRVVAPVPWFPFKQARFGDWSQYAATPSHEKRSGIEVVHPRYAIPPKIGMTIAPLMLALGVLPAFARLIRNGYDFDIIDAHYFYPDGVAAVMLARHFGKAVVITGRGTDLNYIPRYAFPRRMIRWAARRADGLITVSRGLQKCLVDLGVTENNVAVLRNGVDLIRFKPIEREARRAEMGLVRQTLISVGHLVERKGHHLVIESLRQLPGFDLLIVGSGPEEARLRQQAHVLGLTDRVRFMGSIPQEDLPRFYGAADALVLASSREGWANVLLESMACGTPVVASNAVGNEEVVLTPEAGCLTTARTPEAIVEGIQKLFSNYPDRQATRRYAERFSWEETTRGQLRLFRKILDDRQSASTGAAQSTFRT